jgi:uncharacterized protein (TIGR02996 family)
MTLNEDQTFRQLIAAEPENLTLRLVYCDWLEERNDPRHLYLRAWCHLATYPAEEWLGFPDLRIELAGLAKELPSEWLEAVGCRRFYLDRDAALKVAIRYLKEIFVKSKRFWIDPDQIEDAQGGWYLPYRNQQVVSNDPSLPFMTLFVDRGRAEVHDLKTHRHLFQRVLRRRQNGQGPPI